jgi:integrase
VARYTDDLPGNILGDVESDLAARFEAKVNRSGEHHLWTGAHLRDGSGTFKAGGTSPVMARKVAWEMAHGPVPAGAQVMSCEVKACVRVDHLRLKLAKVPVRDVRKAKQARNTRAQVQRNGARVQRRVRGGRAEVEATKVQLREELQRAGPRDRDATSWSLDDLLDHYLVYLEDQGKERRTRERYASTKKNWISPTIGAKPARRLVADDVDRCFAGMRKAGQSASSMNQAKALLSGAFKWARRSGKVLYNPTVGLRLPKSTYVPSDKLPPEAADISVILNAALEQTPDIAPILALAATTGARLGELVALRRSDVDCRRQTLWVRAAADLDGSLKSPKRARHRREVPIDEGTVEVVQRQLDEMRERAAVIGAPLAADPFLFSDEPDCSAPVQSVRVTKRLQVLKAYMGVEDKRPETIALEDQALRLRRCGIVDRSGRPGPAPTNGAAMSYDDIGQALGRSQMWARRAYDAALRRESSAGTEGLSFNLSFNGFRKFTSSELLDAGFNISVVAQRGAAPSWSHVRPAPA